MDLIFSLAEGAVLQQAIEKSSDLVAEATPGLKDRIWLYRSEHDGKDRVSCLTLKGLGTSIAALVERHAIVGDDGKPIQINLSRLRKSFFDRALRAADGDVAVTANLMGNTPQVASYNYPSMNEARQREAAKLHERRLHGDDEAATDFCRPADKSSCADATDHFSEGKQARRPAN